MSNLKAEVTASWGDAEYTFRLTVPCLIELEQKCEAPFTVIFQRLMSGMYGISDIRETLRLALIGGGKAPTEALKLVRQYVDDRPKTESLPVARMVLAGVLFGFEAAPLQPTGSAPEGKAEAAPTTVPNVSTPPPSNGMPPSSGSRLRTLLPNRFGNSQQG